MIDDSETALQSDSAEYIPTNAGTEISGRWIVISMFAFGILSTLMIWFYWNKHIEPFMPLQLAIEKEFENSSPRVEGGQRKISKGTPRILRVTMKVDFNPELKESAVVADERIARIAEISAEFQDLKTYDFLEFHFYQPSPNDSKLHKKSYTRELPSMKEVETKLR